MFTHPRHRLGIHGKDGNDPVATFPRIDEPSSPVNLGLGDLRTVSPAPIMTMTNIYKKRRENHDEANL